MGLAQALDSVLDAAKITLEQIPRVQYVFVGGGIDKPRLEQRARDLGLSNVKFLPRQPIEEMGRILPLADVLLTHLRDDPQFRITIPWKTQSSLYAGVPIINAGHGDAARLVESAGAGIVCEPENPTSIANAVADLESRSPEELGDDGTIGKSILRSGVEHGDRSGSLSGDPRQSGCRLGVVRDHAGGYEVKRLFQALLERSDFRHRAVARAAA